jgi:hypothetical protein
MTGHTQRQTQTQRQRGKTKQSRQGGLCACIPREGSLHRRRGRCRDRRDFGCSYWILRRSRHGVNRRKLVAKAEKPQLQQQTTKGK